jgi:hypothetical protein
MTYIYTATMRIDIAGPIRSGMEIKTLRRLIMDAAQDPPFYKHNIYLLEGTFAIIMGNFTGYPTVINAWEGCARVISSDLKTTVSLFFYTPGSDPVARYFSVGEQLGRNDERSTIRTGIDHS